MKKKLYLFLLCIGIFQRLYAQNISYTSLYDNTTFSRAINQTLPVGSTPGTGAVSPTGGVVYSIPIAVPPGTNGVVPSVSLDYNSQSGAGIAGMGWNLSGLSAITRVGRNFYFDGEVGPVELSANDRFALNGVRLISKSGTYGAANSTYGPEMEDFSTVTAIGTQGNGPQSFKMVTKDGVTMEFGNSTDSRFMDNGGTTVMFWRMNKIQYPDGNYLEYVYSNTDRDSRIIEIRYTGNAAASLAPYNKIEFAYKIRQEAAPGTFSDIRTTYEAGNSIVNKYLLDLITVKAEGTVTKKYQLGYANDKVNSYLKSITEFGSDNSQLNPTIFKYGDKPVEMETGMITMPYGTNIESFTGDFDGDGLDDILEAHQSTNSDGIEYYDSFKTYKQDASGTTFTLLATQNLPNNYTVVKKIEIPNGRGFAPNDYTGDGLDDVLTLNISFNGTQSKLENVVIYESVNGGTAFAAKPPRVVQPNYNIVHKNGNFFYPGDFDGDGLSEYIMILGNSLGTYSPFICSNFGGGGSGSCGGISIVGSAGIAANDWVTASAINVIDFNGDGRSDLMITKDNLTEIFTFSGQGATRIYTSSFPNKDEKPQFADFNGDGKTDLLIVYPDYSIKKAISTGTGFIQSTIPLNRPWPTADGNRVHVVNIGDFNGDQKTDIFYTWSWDRNVPVTGGYEYSQEYATGLYYSQGDVFAYSQTSHDASTIFVPNPAGGRVASANSSVNISPEIATDLNGDGRAELVSSGPSGLSYRAFNRNGKDNLLQKVANGMNYITEWSYQNPARGGSFYTKGTGVSSYPLNVVQPAMNLGYEMKTPNGIGGIKVMQYTYEGARLHRAGKGLVGFAKVTESDLAMGIKTTSENNFNITFFTTLPFRSSHSLISNSTPISTTTIVSEVVSDGTKRFWVKPTSVSENNNLTGGTVVTSNTFDDLNGNITYTKTDINNGLDVVETTTVYGAFPGIVKNKPTSVTMAKTRNGQTPAYTEATTYQYNSLGQVTSKTDFSGSSKSVASVYGYNNLGNLTSTKITPAGMAERLSSSVFDSKGRYPESSLNALNYGSSASYDPKWGKVSTSTDIGGRVTSYTYDGFGRVKSATYPGPVTSNQSYVWDNSNGALWRSDLTYPSGGKADSKIWYDLLGREIRTESEGFGGSTVIQATTYDEKGNTKTNTEPFKTGESYITTTRNYHPDYNWLTSEDKGVLGVTSEARSYSGGTLTLTTTTPSGTEVKVTDASNKIVSATDNGGTLTYSYYNNGEVKDIIKDGVVLTSNEYDAYGRQTKLVDVNAGTITYDFDAMGQLVTQINANGDTHTTAYNVLGELTSKTGPEGTTTYIYGTANTGGESRGKIKQITGFLTGSQVSYTYDALGRIGSVTERIDGTDHTTGYSYNAVGGVVTKTYPSGLVITNLYDGNGYLTNIKKGAVNIFTATGLNGKGQVTNYSLGNGRSSTNTYVNGFPTKFETTGLQSLNMVWDYAKGTLTSRNDARTSVNKTETFAYDNLIRLTGATVGEATFATTYTSNGNIASKTDVGTYSYGASKINAVSGVVNPTSVISALQQEITYTPFMQPSSVTENGYVLNYSYGHNYKRIKGVLTKDNVTVNTRFYFSEGFEKEINSEGTRYIQYISSPGGLAAIIESKNGNHVSHYTYTDHLGSILTVTDSLGTVQAEMSFDVWGRRRNPTTWALLLPTAATGLPSWLYRGYTGHEHLDVFGLINMNGRIYDPTLGRVLSPDNFIQNVFSTQDYNRYTYARNNPMLYTDPDGNNPIITMAIGAVIGGFINGFSYGMQGKAFMAGFWRGAIAGAIAGLTGYYAPIGAIPGAIYGAGTGAVTGGINAALNGTSIGKGMAWGAVMGGVGGGVVGGLKAYYGSANTWSGVEYERPPSNMTASIEKPLNGGTLNEVVIKGKRPIYLNPILSTVSDMLSFTDKTINYSILTMAVGTRPLIRNYVFNMDTFRGTYSGLKKFGGPVGNLANGVETYLDFKSMQAGNMSAGAFLYKTTGTATSIYLSGEIGATLGAAPGAAAGVTVGLGFTAGEYLYKGYAIWVGEMSKGIASYQHAISNGWAPFIR